MTAVWGWPEAIQASKLKSTTKLVLFNLFFYMNSKGQSCYPSIETQASNTGLSRRAVMEHLQNAVDAGFLKRRPHLHSAAFGKGWKINEYLAAYPDENQLKHVAEEMEVSGVENKEDFGGNFDAQKDTSRSLSRSMVVTQGDTNTPLNTPIINKEKYKKKKSDEVTLAEWEKNIGSELRIEMLENWVSKNNLAPARVATLIDLFRDQMISKGKVYSDFASAFKVWLRQGYLGVQFDDVKIKLNKQSEVKFYDRGINL